jgi:hypothetical protein
MIRFVIGPDNEVVPDLKGRLPGRGVWIIAKARYINQAIEKRIFARAFKTHVKQNESLAALIGGLLVQNCLNYLSLARKAGLVNSGFSKVESALKGDIAVLIEARDGAADGKRKLAARAKPGVTRVEYFTSAQLSLALGRPNVVHAAVGSHGLADKFLVAVARIKDYEN